VIARKGVELYSFLLADLIGQDQAAFLCSKRNADEYCSKTLDSIFFSASTYVDSIPATRRHGLIFSGFKNQSINQPKLRGYRKFFEYKSKVSDWVDKVDSGIELRSIWHRVAYGKRVGVYSGVNIR
jgi:hypothetical protein